MTIVFDVVDVSSIVDVGGDAGSWLSAARNLGVQTMTGVESLEDELRLPQTFDLAICIEVIEHLSPARGKSLVVELCRCAPSVLFGAAIPGQRGPDHLEHPWHVA